ncbi:unnamed protein product [Amoebophrya sp. A25]|nr:unnamed protein product [Amoebophrya sp. A25]|eukprot:GSA25T00002983001.1
MFSAAATLHMAADHQQEIFIFRPPEPQGPEDESSQSPVLEVAPVLEDELLVSSGPALPKVEAADAHVLAKVEAADAVPIATEPPVDESVVSAEKVEQPASPDDVSLKCREDLEEDRLGAPTLLRDREAEGSQRGSIGSTTLDGGEDEYGVVEMLSQLSTSGVNKKRPALEVVQEEPAGPEAVQEEPAGPEAVEEDNEDGVRGKVDTTDTVEEQGIIGTAAKTSGTSTSRGAEEQQAIIVTDLHMLGQAPPQAEVPQAQILPRAQILSPQAPQEHQVALAAPSFIAHEDDDHHDLLEGQSKSSPAAASSPSAVQSVQNRRTFSVSVRVRNSLPAPILPGSRNSAPSKISLPGDSSSNGRRRISAPGQLFDASIRRAEEEAVMPLQPGVAVQLPLSNQASVVPSPIPFTTTSKPAARGRASVGPLFASAHGSPIDVEKKSSSLRVRKSVSSLDTHEQVHLSKENCRAAGQPEDLEVDRGNLSDSSGHESDGNPRADAASYRAGGATEVIQFGDRDVTYGSTLVNEDEDDEGAEGVVNEGQVVGGEVLLAVAAVDADPLSVVGCKPVSVLKRAVGDDHAAPLSSSARPSSIFYAPPGTTPFAKGETRRSQRLSRQREHAEAEKEAEKREAAATIQRRMRERKRRLERREHGPGQEQNHGHDQQQNLNGQHNDQHQQHPHHYKRGSGGGGRGHNSAHKRGHRGGKNKHHVAAQGASQSSQFGQQHYYRNTTSSRTQEQEQDNASSGEEEDPVVAEYDEEIVPSPTNNKRNDKLPPSSSPIGASLHQRGTKSMQERKRESSRMLEVKRKSETRGENYKFDPHGRQQTWERYGLSPSSSGVQLLVEDQKQDSQQLVVAENQVEVVDQNVDVDVQPPVEVVKRNQVEDEAVVDVVKQKYQAEPAVKTKQDEVVVVPVVNKNNQVVAKNRSQVLLIQEEQEHEHQLVQAEQQAPPDAQGGPLVVPLQNMEAQALRAESTVVQNPVAQNAVAALPADIATPNGCPMEANEVEKLPFDETDTETESANN